MRTNSSNHGIICARKRRKKRNCKQEKREKQEKKKKKRKKPERETPASRKRDGWIDLFRNLGQLRIKLVLVKKDAHLAKEKYFHF